MNETSLVESIRSTWADREQLEEALRNAPPADGTRRVLEMIGEIQKS
jgi:UDP-N-acetylglucosamine--N-acetylmuramyl-(pentapeptide) pyrophosphoryl-undecaprenol N-acetylglucosamine transferase